MKGDAAFRLEISRRSRLRLLRRPALNSDILQRGHVATQSSSSSSPKTGKFEDEDENEDDNEKMRIVANPLSDHPGS